MARDEEGVETNSRKREESASGALCALHARGRAVGELLTPPPACGAELGFMPRDERYRSWSLSLLGWPLWALALPTRPSRTRINDYSVVCAPDIYIIQRSYTRPTKRHASCAGWCWLLLVRGVRAWAWACALCFGAYTHRAQVRQWHYIRAAVYSGKRKRRCIIWLGAKRGSGGLLRARAHASRQVTEQQLHNL